MTNDIRSRPAVWGIAQGKMPKNGPKALQYTLDLTAGFTVNSPQTWDFTTEVMNDTIEFIQAVAIDNSAGNTALVIICAVTGHKITCPPNSQGIFGLICPAGSVQFQAYGPAQRFNLLFLNIPYAPSVYKVT